YESFGEIQKGNPEPLFQEIYEESLLTILEFKEMESVKYFLNEVLPDMLDEKFIEHSELNKVTQKIVKANLEE
ncbi:hydrolase, partial [Heyndrickxia sporothermodurans]